LLHFLKISIGKTPQPGQFFLQISGYLLNDFGSPFLGGYRIGGPTFQKAVCRLKSRAIVVRG
jgi:hypothetical protein